MESSFSAGVSVAKIIESFPGTNYNIRYFDTLQPQAKGPLLILCCVRPDAAELEAKHQGLCPPVASFELPSVKCTAFLVVATRILDRPTGTLKSIIQAMPAYVRGRIMQSGPIFFPLRRLHHKSVYGYKAAESVAYHLVT